MELISEGAFLSILHQYFTKKGFIRLALFISFINKIWGQQSSWMILILSLIYSLLQETYFKIPNHIPIRRDPLKSIFFQFICIISIRPILYLVYLMIFPVMNDPYRDLLNNKSFYWLDRYPYILHAGRDMS